MRPRVDVDMQQRMPLAQFAKAGEQALRPEQRQDTQVQAQQREIFRLTFDRPRQRFELRIDRFEKGMPIVGQLHRLARAGEQLLADEFLEIADPPRQRGRAQPEFIGRGTRRAKPHRTHERFEGAQGGKSAGCHESCTL